jgi:hypothetical protein
LALPASDHRSDLARQQRQVGSTRGLLGAPFAVAAIIGAVAFLVMVSLITALVVRSVISFHSGLEARFPSGSAAELAPRS